MNDLLSSLIRPSNSQESFHSTSSQPPIPSPPTKNLPNDNVHTAALQAVGLPVYDVETYLNDPKNKAIVSAKGKEKASSSAPQPVQLSVKTHNHMAALNQLCQERSLVPQFEIGGFQDAFGGTLIVGNETITTENRWGSKKEVKEALAEKGLVAVKAMEGNAKIVASGSSENWIGKLLEIHNATDPTTGPVYTEYALGLSFACTCTIPSHPSPFGSPTLAFSSKKAARANSAREAVLHLKSAGLTNPDGSAKTRKKVTLGTAVRIEGKGMEIQKGTTFAQKVNDICPLLGLPPPTYQFTSLPSAPSMLSGAAHFPSNPFFPKPMGEVRNVFGKKNAKEECARGLWEDLVVFAKGRGIDVSGEADLMEF